MLGAASNYWNHLASHDSSRAERAAVATGALGVVGVSAYVAARPVAIDGDERERLRWLANDAIAQTNDTIDSIKRMDATTASVGAEGFVPGTAWNRLNDHLGEQGFSNIEGHVGRPNNTGHRKYYERRVWSESTDIKAVRELREVLGAAASGHRASDGIAAVESAADGIRQFRGSLNRMAVVDSIPFRGVFAVAGLGAFFPGVLLGMGTLFDS